MIIMTQKAKCCHTGLIVKWLFLKLFWLNSSPHRLAHYRAIFLWQLSTGLHHLPLFSQLRSPLFWPHSSMSSASLFCELITLFSITQLSNLCPKVQIIFLENYNFNVCVVLFAFFGISAQWICYFMHWVNWNCQTNTYLVWHLGSITLMSPSCACVPVCLPLLTVLPFWAEHPTSPLPLASYLPRCKIVNKHYKL